MKPFEEVKIVACFSAFDDEKYINKVLDNLSKYTQEFYVNLNDATPQMTEIIKQHPYVKRWVETTKNGRQWGFAEQGKGREAALRLLDDVKPDIVLAPDTDELYCNNLNEQLKIFWENEEYKTFWFRLLYLHGDEKHFRNDGVWKSLHHVRIFKWQSDITFLPYPGYACPATYINLAKNTRYNSNRPITHLGYKDAEDRRRKFLRGGSACDYNNATYKEEMDKNALILELPKELL